MLCFIIFAINCFSCCIEQMNAHNVNSLIGLNINFQNIHYVGDSLIGELEIDRSLEA
jgi:hypothetical protein